MTLSSVPRTVLLVSLSMASLAGCSPGGGPYDVVIAGGRVMDPESGLDGVRHIGIRGGTIQAVTEQSLEGSTVIDATGLVVAPGFIDLHVHGHTSEIYNLQAMDGVTSSLELEVGTADVAGWYDEHEGDAVVNYGVSIGHIPTRMAVMNDPGPFLPSGDAAQRAATEGEIEEMKGRIATGLRDGAVAVGFGWAYTPAATHWEMLEMFRQAAAAEAAVHIHIAGGSSREGALMSAIATAQIAGAGLHVVHVNSSGGPSTQRLLSLIAAAQISGLDVTTECYPYTAGMTMIESALFDDWETWESSRYGTFQWVATGERLTRQSFARYRRQGGEVIIHSNTEDVVAGAVNSPLTMIASDGFLQDGKGHPRTSGTYSRVLGRYVREGGQLDLMAALRKMSLMPAQRLERRVPQMARKGRIKVGADADLVAFDPSRVIDRSTYQTPATPSEGMQAVLINGVVVVKDGRLQEGARPGRAIRAPRS